MNTARMMRFLLLCLFILASGLSVKADEAQPWPGDRTFVVGFAQDHMANDWRAAQVRDVQTELAKYPFIRFVFTDAGGNTARQVMDIENLAAQKVDVLITSPRDARAMAPVISAVYRSGIPVILLSRSVTGNDYTTFVHASNRDIARKAAQHLAKKLGGEGRILILQHIPTTTPAIERTEGFMDELKKYPGLKVVAMKRADSLRGLAIQRVEEALVEEIEFDAIYAQSDSMAAGARIALQKAGIDPATIPIVGIDYIPEARDAIRAGKQSASFTYPTFGKEGVDLAIRILKGETVPKEVIVESTAVTSENVDKVDPIF